MTLLSEQGHDADASEHSEQLPESDGEDGSSVAAPESPAPQERLRDTRKQKKSFMKEIELTEGTARWDAPSGSRSGRGARRAADTINMVVDVIKMVEMGSPTCKRAMETNEAESWAAAIKSEEDSIMRNGTFQVVEELPTGKKAIPTKVVLTKKLDPRGKPIRYKARLVAQGFRQIPGVNFFSTFAPVAALDTVRLILSIAAAADYEIEQLDVVTAFLGRKVEEEIYISLPEGILGGPRLARLVKALYGLKQSPRCWNITINEFIINELGFSRSRFDPCVYRHLETGVFILIYVDDLLIIGRGPAVAEVKRRLAQRFEVVFLGPVRHFLGMVVTRDRQRGTISLGQGGYVERVLDRFGLAVCHGVSTPLDPKVRYIPFDGDVDKEFDPTEYWRAIGALRWLADATRPDIAYATSLLGRYAETPGERHWMGVKRVFRYLAKTRGLQLHLGGSMGPKEFVGSFVGYVDADFAGDISNFRSTTGYLFKIGIGVVAWHSRKQCITATSTADAEFIATAAAIGELLCFGSC